MRTTLPLMIVLVLGVATLMWAGSGVGALYGPSDPVEPGRSAENIEDRADQLPEQEEGEDGGGLVSNVRPGDDNFLGLIVSGVGAATSFVTSVVLLPVELQRLFGLPGWFARPLGLLAQALAAFGFFQFVISRRYE